MIPTDNKVSLKANDNSLDNNHSGNLSADLNSSYLSRCVRFTFRDCCLNGDNGICKTLCHKDVADDLFKTLKKFEDMKWNDFMNLRRQKGWSQEKRGSQNYALFKNEFPNYTQFGHIRVNSKSHKTFRIFCGRIDDMVAILKIDVKGKINH